MWYNNHAGMARRCFVEGIDERQEMLLNGGLRLKGIYEVSFRGGERVNIYEVTYSFADYDYEHARVWAANKREVRKIMKNQFGSNVVIHEIEKEW